MAALPSYSVMSCCPNGEKTDGRIIGCTLGLTFLDTGKMYKKYGNTYWRIFSDEYCH